MPFFSSTAKPLSRYRIHGVVASLFVHATAVALLVAGQFEPWWYAAYQSREARAIQVTYSAGERPREHHVDAVPPVRMVTTPEEVTGEMLRERIDDLAAENATLTDAEQLEKLDRLTARLNQVADAESVDRLAGTFQALTGTKPRASRPAAEPAQGDFDLDTAQIHDVRRDETSDGKIRYFVILLDADGRTEEVEMDAAAGEQMFATMQRIKSNPLLEQVYRQIAMPLFDQMLAGVRQTSAAASKLERNAASVQVHDHDQTPASDSPVVESEPGAAMGTED